MRVAAATQWLHQDKLVEHGGPRCCSVTLSPYLYVTECQSVFVTAAGIQASQYDEQFLLLFTTTLTQLKQVM